MTPPSTSTPPLVGHFSTLHYVLPPETEANQRKALLPATTDRPATTASNNCAEGFKRPTEAPFLPCASDDSDWLPNPALDSILLDTASTSPSAVTRVNRTAGLYGNGSPRSQTTTAALAAACDPTLAYPKSRMRLPSQAFAIASRALTRDGSSSTSSKPDSSPK